MQSIPELLTKFEKALYEQQIKDFPRQLYAPIKYTLELGGKRIRPILVLMGCNLFNDDISAAMPQAIAIEFFHNFTLIHDDIMDDAPVRRGKPTVYKKWNGNTAILSGDTLFAMAYQYAQKADPDILGDVLSVFSQTAVEVCEGQQLDLDFEERNDVTVNEYLEMIRLKTGVLLAASLKIGAIIGRGPKEDVENLYKMGEAIGMGFQLEDDYLDTFGDEKVFGKKTGGDIVTNKKTYLYLRALEKADKATKQKLIDIYSNRTANAAEKIDTVKDIFRQLNVDEDSKLLIDEYFNEGIDYLNKISISEDKKAILTSVARSMVKRNK
jgi:geranylgeranyl diphosphate synthase type II